MSLPTDSLPKPSRRTVQGLGHVLIRHLAARKGVLRRVTKSDLHDELRPWIRELQTGELAGEGAFVVGLEHVDQGFRMSGAFGSASEGKSAEIDLPQLLELPLGVNDPTWNALFHLRSLREFWALEMRANHLEMLEKVLPSAYLLDPAPLAPGSWIGGLGITSWEDLVGLRAAGRSFRIDDATGRRTMLTLEAPEDAWQRILHSALRLFPANPCVIAEVKPQQNAVPFTAVYLMKSDRVDLHCLLDGSGKSIDLS